MDVEAIDLLTSIDRTLKAMLGHMQQRSAQAMASAPKPVASDRDLDGKYGNPKVKFMPRDWTGRSFVGQPMSDCPPGLLDLLAETFDYFAKKADEKHETTDKGKPVADFKRADAARARGWAKRMREGKHQAPAATERSSVAPAGWEEEENGAWR